MKVWICGSRSAKSYLAVEKHLNLLLPVTLGIQVGHGRASKGVDRFVAQWARNFNVDTYELPAEWDRGQHAGKLRSEVGIDWADKVIAIWDEESPGTRHCIEYAEQTGTPLEVIRF